MGRIVEVYGPESSGKTTLTLASLLLQRREWVKRAHSWMRSTHLTLSTLKSWALISMRCLVSQPDTGEQALEICDALLARSGAVSTWLWSTRLLHLHLKLRSKATWAIRHMGLQARLLSQALRKLTGNLSNSSNTVWLSSLTKSV